MENDERSSWWGWQSGTLAPPTGQEEVLYVLEAMVPCFSLLHQLNLSLNFHTNY